MNHDIRLEKLLTVYSTKLRPPSDCISHCWCGKHIDEANAFE